LKKEKNMSINLEYPLGWDTSDGEDRKSTPLHSMEEMQELFNRASFDGERFVMNAGDASFAIVPLEDLFLLEAQGV
jgi:hypothetical protein